MKMSDFATTMALGAEAALEVLDAESITYTPVGAAGLIRSVLVRRLPPRDIGIGVVPLAEVTLRHDATAGRLASAIDTGGDTITWSPKPGGTTKVSRILEIVSVNGGFVTVLIG